MCCGRARGVKRIGMSGGKVWPAFGMAFDWTWMIGPLLRSTGFEMFSFARRLRPHGRIAAGRSNGRGHCRQPCVIFCGLHTAAPAAALIAGIAFGDGSPGAALPPHRITLGLFDPPYLAPLPALGSGGSESRRCGCAGPLLVHGQPTRQRRSHQRANPAFPHTALSPHGGAVDHAPFGEESCEGVCERRWDRG